MGTWSIVNPNPHPLASIDQTGKVTFADHSIMTSYTIQFVGTTAETKCEQTQLRGNIVVYPCTSPTPCSCSTNGTTIGSGTTSSKIVVGTHSSSNCSGGWSTSLKSGVDILRDIEFRNDGNIYAYVISANTSPNTRITQYNTFIGSCSDYFSVVQLGNNPTPSVTYSYTFKTNHEGETVEFSNGSSRYTYTTDSSGVAVHTATTNSPMTARIIYEEDIIDYGDGYTFHGVPVYQYGGSVTINANQTKEVKGIYVRYNTNTSVNNAAVVFDSYGKVWDYTSLRYDETDIGAEGRSLPSWVNQLKFVGGTYDMVNSLADNNEGGSGRSGSFTLYINGISTNKTFTVFQV